MARRLMNEAEVGAMVDRALTAPRYGALFMLSRTFDLLASELRSQERTGFTVTVVSVLMAAYDASRSSWGSAISMLVVGLVLGAISLRYRHRARNASIAAAMIQAYAEKDEEAERSALN